MKHLVIADYGTFLGTREGLLWVRNSNESCKTYPLNRLRTLSIAKNGVSISSDLVNTLSDRGIKLFFLGFKGTAQASLISHNQHGVVAIRMNQIGYCQNDTLSLARKIVSAKIRNQRAVINYFAKYHKDARLVNAGESLKQAAAQAEKSANMEQLLGFEGVSARMYFSALKEASLFSDTFNNREGRGSREINNSMLNFGYAILSSYILSAIENAGLEPHVGLFHAVRPGKMALVLDLMEEYRAWVVDRNVIKLRYQSRDHKFMTPDLKRNLIMGIQKTCNTRYPYRKKKVRLEHIIQRQVYRLCGEFCGKRTYKPYLFKW